MTAFAKCLLAMCEQVKDLLKTESRLLRLRSPVYILGMVCVSVLFSATNLDDVCIHLLTVDCICAPTFFDCWWKFCLVCEDI